MSAIRIDNKTGDGIIAELDGTEYFIEDESSVTVNNSQKGEHTVIITRARIPKESSDSNASPKGIELLKSEDEKPGSHVQLSLVSVFESNASKTTVEIRQSVKGIENIFEDIIFSGYSVSVSGGKVISHQSRFANEKIKRSFALQQFKSAFFPAGIAGIIVLIAGLFFTVSNLTGFAAKGFGLMKSIILLAGGIIITAYFIICLIKTKQHIRRLWKK